MVKGLMAVWAAEALKEMGNLLQRAGKTEDENERAHLEARIQEQKERRAALKILTKKWR